MVGRSFCVSLEDPRDLEVCHEIGESVMLDNGAFTKWMQKRGDVDLEAFAEWVRPWLDYRTSWCVIPDKIDGCEDDNDVLVTRWEMLGLPFEQCAPVWHMHESVDRLVALASAYPRVCVGSSGDYKTLGSPRWHLRMREAMDATCGNGPPPCWLHMLRGLSLAGSEYPFASADSTGIAQNHAGNNTRLTAPQDVNKMADRIGGRQCAARWHVVEQMGLEV